MKKYQCHKEVLAEPMTRGAYNKLQGWHLPKRENGADEGYLVEYLGDSSNHPDYAFYITWTPKAVFESGYFEIVDVPLSDHWARDDLSLWGQIKSAFGWK